MRDAALLYELLLSLPPAGVAAFAGQGEASPCCFACSDPTDRELGSGGGTTHLLVEAWRQAWGTNAGAGTFAEWLTDTPKLIIHAGGRSRRSPAYAPQGKILTPMPVWRWSWGQSLRQNLLDLQLDFLEDVVERAPQDTAVILSSGDVFLRSGEGLPDLPDADVVCLGLWGSAELASHFGVFFSSRGTPDVLDFVLQKPDPATIRDHSRTHLFLVDSGIWLLSQRAVKVLMAKSRWSVDRAEFADGGPANYDLYSSMGMALGLHPSVPDSDISVLTAAAVPIPKGEFYHFGTTVDVIESSLKLQNLVVEQAGQAHVAYKTHPAVFTQNSHIGKALTVANSTIWIENSCIPDSWELTRYHMITGVPENNWRIALSEGQCLDIVPVGETGWCLRPYGMDDAFRGTVGAETTLWQGMPLIEWFRRRGLSFGAADIDPGEDIHDAALFPVVDCDALTGAFIRWMLADGNNGKRGGQIDASSESHVLNHPAQHVGEKGRGNDTVPEPLTEEELRKLWLSSERLSANELNQRANVARTESQRAEFRRKILPEMAARGHDSVFYRLDLRELAAEFARFELPLPPENSEVQAPLTRAHSAVFAAETKRLSEDEDWKQCERKGFELLRDEITAQLAAEPVAPCSTVMADQIVWARSPVRLDLAGGWTDTPPYCCLHGGRVVNIAANLNGQPPIQVFAKPSAERKIVLRSIDLGLEERITEYAELRAFTEVGGAFSIPKAALAIAGFLPEFASDPAGTLGEQLERAGGGIELTLLSAVPKGSGLGTSSILSATALGALSEMYGLKWNLQEVVKRTLAIEQMLTTGGGWQDQAGGIFPGAKLIETDPGMGQRPNIRWVPTGFLEQLVNRELLLYYTGITRTAKNILHEIVRGMFLNDASCLRTLNRIKAHAAHTFDAVQRQDRNGFYRAIEGSWRLNCNLDPGTNPPEIQSLLQRLAPWHPKSKLLGAGGGGYMLIAADSPETGAAIRRCLTTDPPNALARFVDMSISADGLQVTRS